MPTEGAEDRLVRGIHVEILAFQCNSQLLSQEEAVFDIKSFGGSLVLLQDLWINSRLLFASPGHFQYSLLVPLDLVNGRSL
jgi:hypothetical protein